MRIITNLYIPEDQKCTECGDTFNDGANIEYSDASGRNVKHSYCPACHICEQTSKTADLTKYDMPGMPSSYLCQGCSYIISNAIDAAVRKRDSEIERAKDNHRYETAQENISAELKRNEKLLKIYIFINKDKKIQFDYMNDMDPRNIPANLGKPCFVYDPKNTDGDKEFKETVEDIVYKLWGAWRKKHEN